ncbi:LacI family DNA-binding transcriptional regulator [Massilia sp. 2TAF26]|uniref:LacI family DNA-binding transcriptional regulator n=1 Tax=Massilia sp. 2TAF26 TaxID=3233012 RepID=UPI003F96F9D4
MTVTVRDLAHLTGCSIGTVSRALKNQPGLGEPTRARILSAARELGYDFNRLRLGAIRRIAFLLHEQHNTLSSSPFYSPVLQGAEQACRRAGVALSFYVVHPGEAVAELVRAQQPDAILCAGYFEPELVAVLRDSGKPLVLVDMHLPGFTSVNPDHHLGGYLATRHLIRTGRRRIAMIAGSLAHYSIHQRERGYRKALFEARMLADPELEVHVPGCADPAEGVRQAMLKLLAMKPRPDALFCYNDSAALTAMQTCLDAGLKVPSDIAIVGFDDISAAAQAIPPLSSIAIDKEALGAAGVALLLDKQNAEQTLPVQLIVRESSYDD